MRTWRLPDDIGVPVKHAPCTRSIACPIDNIGDRTYDENDAEQI